MRRAPERVDFGLYGRALGVYARNLGVLVPIFIGMIVVVLINLFSNWFWSPVGGAGAPLTGLIANLVQGFTFAIGVIAADDAWRHGRVNIASAWDNARRHAGNILIAVLGFAFLVWVATIIGGVLPIPYLSYVLMVLALWAFVYTIPAAAIGGIPGTAALSYSLNLAKRNPIATAVLLVVSGIVYYLLAIYAIGWLTWSLPLYAMQAMIFLLTSIAMGYVALVVAKQYADLSFRPYW